MKFLRRNSNRHLKLGRKRREKQKWRRPTGRHNKMREKRRGYSQTVSIGYKKDDNEREKVRGLNPILIMNVNDLSKIKNGDIGIVGKVGKKKKIEIIKKAEENQIQIYNINIKKFMRKNKIK